MWVAKVKITGDNVLMGNLCKKHNISLMGYPISTNHDKNYIFVYFAIVLYGDDKSKESFYSELKKSERINGIEKNGDFIIGNLKENKKVDSMYKYNLIHVDPVYIDKTGYEIWTVASFNKKDLDSIVKKMEKLYKCQLLKFVNERITNISIKSIHPELTTIQKKAMEIAIQNGYYVYPRKTELKKLSKLMNISYSTYHAHLRKAEMKLLPFFLDKSL